MMKNRKQTLNNAARAAEVAVTEPGVAPPALPMQTREAPVSSVDVGARTADVVFSTGASVRRRRYVGWDTVVPFDEILLVSREAINLDRLNAGAPALDSHSMFSTGSQVGVVENARIEKGEARATIRFPSKGVDEAADRMFAMVSEGIIRNISCGYSIDEVEIKQSEKVGEVEQRIVKRWTPMEISFVTIPADPGAQVRAADMQHFPVLVSRAGGEIVIRGDSPVDAATAATRMRMRQRSIAQV